MRVGGTVRVVAVLAIVAMAPDARAQSAVGTWTGETSGTGGLARRPIELVLAPDGSGTMEVDVVQEVVDLEIDGDHIAFGFRPQILGRPANFLFRYEGEFDAEKMTLRVAMDRGDGPGLAFSEETLVLTRE